MKYVIKRDNRKVTFHQSKITDAILKAAENTNIGITPKEVSEVKEYILSKLDKMYANEITVEEIQDLVVESLSKLGHKELSKAYDMYRVERTKLRESKSELMQSVIKIGVETDRDNANVGNNFSAKLLRIASETNK
jgi:ribonucleoside-triphosphate reductase